MDAQSPEDVGRNCDLRLDRIEQFLPTLATKAELQAAVAPLVSESTFEARLASLATKADLETAVALLATKAELAAAIAPLATKAELAAAIAPLATKAELAAAIAPLATKAELRAEIQAESTETRRYMKILVEDLRDDIRIMTEGLVTLDARDARQHAERLHAQAGLETRVKSLEAGRRPPRAR